MAYLYNGQNYIAFCKIRDSSFEIKKKLIPVKDPWLLTCTLTTFKSRPNDQPKKGEPFVSKTTHPLFNPAKVRYDV